jgi:hypothetical protein
MEVSGYLTARSEAGYLARAFAEKPTKLALKVCDANAAYR